MNNSNVAHIVVDVWGDLACFTRPETKVERMSYPCITPSAARGILCAIYMKPIEFYYEIEKIEIIKPIKWINIFKNELKEKISSKLEPIYTRDESSEKGRTQRNTFYLRDVYYRIYAKIVKRNDFTRNNVISLYEQFMRRLRKGQCFYQPCLGLRECVCHFSEPNWDLKPDKSINVDVGMMLYDVFNICDNVPLITKRNNENNGIANISFFNAKIEDGVLIVPSFDSLEIRRAKDVKTHS